MAEAGPGAAGGYVAFISYSHKDAAIGRWLHRRLEAYRLPRRLVGTRGEDGEIPERLVPIFRDRDELPAAGDLSEKVRNALAVSRNLVVICSPNSAASPWVAKEIATFRHLHPDRPIFTAIVEGEPAQCFPAALREGGVEPLAADLRKEGDGRRLGLLKLVAGLAGVGLDALVQRDAARRIRRVTYVTAAAVAAMLVMALLTAFALNARAEAQRQRSEAEGLVEFMLTDLRRELKGVASLRVLTAANQRALQYYRSQNLEGLAPESLERRARILHAMGEDDINRDRLDRALASFEEAAATTRRLLEEQPRDPDRIYAHSLSEFWVGRVDHKRKNYARARQAFQRYKALVETLVATDPGNRKWREELAYAEGSLCTVSLDSRTDLDLGLRSCAGALANMRTAARGSRDPAMIHAVANRYAWLADAYRAQGDLVRAWPLRLRQEQMLAALLKADPDNLDFKESWLTNQFSIAELEIDRGARDAARTRLRRALVQVEALTRADPDNATWASRRKRIVYDLAKTGNERGQ
jgi:tetratricopeptide (TPR) repeat protein